MTTPPSDNRFIQPDAKEAAAKQADELFIHGLLGTLHDTESRGRRVDAAMLAIPISLSPARNPLAHHRFVRMASAAVIGLVVLAGIALMVLPTSNSAYATVSASIQAAKTDGTRRYEMRVAHLPGDTLPEKPSGIVDSSGPDQFLMRIFAPNGHIVVAGRDEKGEWCIRLDGGIEREHPRNAWPNFASVNGESVFAESVDKFLEALELDYNLHSEGLVALPNKPDIKCKHIVADRKPGPARRQAQRVKLWIDPKTKELQRLEMSWPGAKLDNAELEKLANQPDDQRPLDQGPQDQGPQDQRPRDRGPGGGGGEGPDDLRPEPREPGPPPEGRPLDDGSRPFGPEGRPPRDDGPRPPRPEGRQPGGPGGPPFGPGRPGPRNGPPRRMPPLSRFVLERVDAPQFAEDWFRPESHLKEQGDLR